MESLLAAVVALLTLQVLIGCAQMMVSCCSTHYTAAIYDSIEFEAYQMSLRRVSRPYSSRVPAVYPDLGRANPGLTRANPEAAELTRDPTPMPISNFVEEDPPRPKRSNPEGDG